MQEEEALDWAVGHAREGTKEFPDA